MFRKVFASLMLIAAIATAVGVIPGVIDNVAYACSADDPACEG